MRVKAIRDLAQRSDPDLFREIASGLDLIAQNAFAREDDARHLWQERRRGYAILRAVAVEEAAKFLILLDAVRCPRQLKQHFGQQLVRFHDHLSKGIYAQACEWRPATFADVEGWIKRERTEFYLDGPNDVDWIFPNEILNGRESKLYVDFVKTDEGHVWVEPRQYDVILDAGFPYHSPRVLTLVRGLHALGFADPGALEVIAKTWRSVKMSPDFHSRELRNLNRQTLDRLRDKGLLRDAPERTCATVIDLWLFPLYSLDLSPIPVDQNRLRAVQDGYWYREMGV